MTLSVAGIAARCLAFAPCSFPQVIAKMQRISVDPDCSIPLVSSILLSDPMFSALAISRACVGSDFTSATVSASVAKLGLAAVQGLCQDIRPIPDSQRQIMAAHWSQANACAQMTRLLAPFCQTPFAQRSDEEQLGILGLLHNLGAPAAELLFPQAYAAAGEQLRGDASKDFNDCLRAQLGVCCFHVGALIARAWHLPEDVRAVIRYHHDPEAAVEQQEVAALVHVARNQVKGCGFTAGADIYVAPIKPGALRILGLRQPDILRCIKRYYDEVEELSLYEASFANAV
jgi:HD-like signal output (HDOD) protein